MTAFRALPVLTCCILAEPAEQWALIAGEQLRGDEAYQQAEADLITAGAAAGIEFAPVEDNAEIDRNAVLVGNTKRNRMTESFVSAGSASIQPVHHPQGYQIQTISSNGKRLLLVAGDSLIGEVYGMYWLWDRLRVTKGIPDINVTRVPRLPVRLAGGESQAAVRNALRYGATWVSSYNVLDIVPWGVEPEDSMNARHREELGARVRLAHDLHLKFLAGCDEISYHPALWQKLGVIPSPADPALWNALQEKYRRLFTAMPELDGVLIRTGELTLVPSPYQAYDVMHEPPGNPLPLEERYRTFLRKMHEVVVGEFNKIYFHRTWGTSAVEQHSNPDVFKKTFTETVPTRNLYLSPYMTKADRWLYQPFNPTFNLTPHAMVVLLSTMDYHARAGVNVVPIYPGRYFHDFLRNVLSAKASNLVGAHFAPPVKDDWQVQALTAYTAARLAWNPAEDPRTIAEDFAAIHFGRGAARDVAEILLCSFDAYKDGCYIKPVAESVTGNTLPHLRITTFPVRGIPLIDRGREHIAWLRSSMYTPCVGRFKEAISHLDRGLDMARRMEAIGQRANSKIEDPARARELQDALALTRALIETNNRYVRTCLAYFSYCDAPNEAKRRRLSNEVEAFTGARHRFVQTPGCVYKLYGIDQLLVNAREALDDVREAQRRLAAAPDAAGVQSLIAQYQRRVGVAWARSPDRVSLLHWRGRVDGKEILNIHGKNAELEHVEGDHAQVEQETIAAALPAREVTVLVRDIASRPWGPFVIEQPCASNDFRAKVLLYDAPPSSGIFDFEVAYVDKPPRDLDLVPPWSDQSRSDSWRDVNH